jgi:hypothetical protein
MADALRIVQWTTGNVGQRTVRAVLAHPDMDLVGCYAWSAGKAGQDVASLCALDSPTGVTATNDVAALLALRPDCVIYNPKWCNPEELSKILESGANVVTTAGFITGHALGADRARLAEACAKGGTTLFGSGMNPGLANLLGIVSWQLCDRIDSISVLESVDSTGYDSPETELLVGFGKPIDHPGLQEMTASGTAVFSDAVHLMADAFRIELDEVRCLVEYAQTTEDLDLGSWSIAAGCVAGVAISWQGIRDGRTVISLNARWRKGRTLEPDWQIEHGYVVDIQGQPCVRTRIEVFPGEDFVANSFKDYMVIGMIMTAMPAVNAIPAVVAAPAGIATYNDLPLIGPWGAATAG